MYPTAIIPSNFLAAKDVLYIEDRQPGAAFHD